MGALAEGVTGMLEKLFKRRFKVGDTVRLIRTGQTAVIVDKSTLPVAKKEVTTFILKFKNGSPSVAVLPEDIQRVA